MSGKSPSIWGDIVFVCVIVGMLGVILAALRWLGILPQLQFADFLILTGAALSLGITAMFNIYASDGRAYHRLGFELCSLTFGTCLSLVTAELWSGKDVLPRLGNLAFGKTLSHPQQVALVAFLGFVSVFGLAFTAHIVRAVDNTTKPPKNPNVLSMISFTAGFTILFGYVYVLLGAGA
jgi:hypothetical protein